jgi:hypothetical protein
MKYLSRVFRSKLFRWIAVSVAILVIVAVLSTYLVIEFCIKQKPFATYADYEAQLERHRVTDDVVGQWNYGFNTINSLDYMQRHFFDEGEPYRVEKYQEWCDKYFYDSEVLDREGHDFYSDADYGWPKELRGAAWRYAIEAWAYGMPSLAIIEPERTREVAYCLKVAAEAHRSPAMWMDYAIYEQWGSPWRDNMQWKGPQLILEGLYTLVSGDREYFDAEMKELARSLYRDSLANQQKPPGEGYCAGVCCEPHQWFPQ